MSLFGKHPPTPIAAHAGSRVGHEGWWVLADDDQRVLAGPFRSIGRANEVAQARSAGQPWRWQPGD